MGEEIDIVVQEIEEERILRSTAGVQLDAETQKIIQEVLDFPTEI